MPPERDLMVAVSLLNCRQINPCTTFEELGGEAGFCRAPASWKARASALP
ncbi:MAG: hypothetical protein GY737_29210 [Desulfobacteraceae bacterium]|nr:hypothetical protein [Desulfobacteraceae bacterium]